VWVMSVMSSPFSALTASMCVVAVQHHLLLTLVSCCVLCPMRPTRHCILCSLGWGPCQALGVPLPLAVDPMGHPRCPRPGVLTRGAQISAELHRTCWRAVVHVCCLLICYGPPYYRMGSLLYQLLGGCALWPGWMGRVTICPTLFGGCGPLQPFAGCGCAIVVVHFPVWGVVTRPCCDSEEVILHLRGGVYGELTPSDNCPALCGGFRLGDLSEGNLGMDTVIFMACWLAPAFTAQKGDIVLEEAVDLGLWSPARRRL
jgi:hypothetical protein